MDTKCEDCIWYFNCNNQSDFICEDFYPADDEQSTDLIEQIYKDNISDWAQDEYMETLQEYR